MISKTWPSSAAQLGAEDSEELKPELNPLSPNSYRPEAGVTVCETQSRPTKQIPTFQHSNIHHMEHGAQSTPAAEIPKREVMLDKKARILRATEVHS